MTLPRWWGGRHASVDEEDQQVDELEPHSRVLRCHPVALVLAAAVIFFFGAATSYVSLSRGRATAGSEALQLQQQARQGGAGAQLHTQGANTDSLQHGCPDCAAAAAAQQRRALYQVQQPLLALGSGSPPHHVAVEVPPAKPYYDFVLAVFSGDGVDAVSRRDQMRRIYDAYGGVLRVTDEKGAKIKYTFKMVFLVSHIDAAEDGDLVGDILYVQCPAGYRNIVQKTKAMLSIVAHLNFRYLMKSDDDTFVCLNRLARRLHLVPEDVKSKVYAGIPTACGLESNTQIGRVIKDPTHKWYDAKFVSHTLGGLDCYPAYHQGAFYVLAEPLVQYLHRGRSKLLTFINEDVTMGTWMMGVDREMVALNSISEARLWECTCSRFTKWLRYDSNCFFHNCKLEEQLDKCSQLLRTC